MKAITIAFAAFVALLILFGRAQADDSWPTLEDFRVEPDAIYPGSVMTATFRLNDACRDLGENKAGHVINLCAYLEFGLGGWANQGYRRSFHFSVSEFNRISGNNDSGLYRVRVHLGKEYPGAYPVAFAQIWSQHTGNPGCILPYISWLNYNTDICFLGERPGIRVLPCPDQAHALATSRDNAHTGNVSVL